MRVAGWVFGAWVGWGRTLHLVILVLGRVIVDLLAHALGRRSFGGVHLRRAEIGRGWAPRARGVSGPLLAGARTSPARSLDILLDAVAGPALFFSSDALFAGLAAMAGVASTLAAAATSAALGLASTAAAGVAAFSLAGSALALGDSSTIIGAALLLLLPAGVLSSLTNCSNTSSSFLPSSYWMLYLSFEALAST